MVIEELRLVSVLIRSLGSPSPLRVSSPVAFLVSPSPLVKEVVRLVTVAPIGSGALVTLASLGRFS